MTVACELEISSGFASGFVSALVVFGSITVESTVVRTYDPTIMRSCSASTFLQIECRSGSGRFRGFVLPFSKRHGDWVARRLDLSPTSPRHIVLGMSTKRGITSGRRIWKIRRI